jgi:hypothetical protein
VVAQIRTTRAVAVEREPATWNRSEPSTSSSASPTAPSFDGLESHGTATEGRGQTIVVCSTSNWVCSPWRENVARKLAGRVLEEVGHKGSTAFRPRPVVRRTSCSCANRSQAGVPALVLLLPSCRSRTCLDGEPCFVCVMGTGAVPAGTAAGRSERPGRAGDCAWHALFQERAEALEVASVEVR